MYFKKKDMDYLNLVFILVIITEQKTVKIQKEGRMYNDEFNVESLLLKRLPVGKVSACPERICYLPRSVFR